LDGQTHLEAVLEGLGGGVGLDGLHSSVPFLILSLL
jgi:hypothetical protein